MVSPNWLLTQAIMISLILYSVGKNCDNVWRIGEVLVRHCRFSLHMLMLCCQFQFGLLKWAFWSIIFRTMEGLYYSQTVYLPISQWIHVLFSLQLHLWNLPYDLYESYLNVNLTFKNRYLDPVLRVINHFCVITCLGDWPTLLCNLPIQMLYLRKTMAVLIPIQVE